MVNIDDLYQDPNAGAYEKEEVRTGPPLSYVVEKLRNAVESAHRIYRGIERHVPDNLPRPEGAAGTSYSTKQDGLIAPAYSAFQYSLTAFLALYNQLGRIGEQEKIAALLELASQDFSDWLDSVEREGSVIG